MKPKPRKKPTPKPAPAPKAAAPPKKKKVRNVRKPKGGENWRKVFLGHLAKGGIIAAACRKAKVGVVTVFDHRARDAAFDAQVQAALEESIDAVELEIRRRAITGVNEPVYYKGIVAGHVRRYSDGLLTLLAKAKRRKEFGDKSEISGPDGAAIPLTTTAVPFDHDAYKKLFDQYATGAAADPNHTGGGGAGPAAADGAGQPLDPQNPQRPDLPQHPAGRVPDPPR